LGLLGVIVFGYAQADAAQEKLASQWALGRRERQRLATAAALSVRDAFTDIDFRRVDSNQWRLHFG
jgi:hypothetical protein